MNMKVTRFDAALTYALAALGLWISYTALADLAARAGLGLWQAHAWPLVVDGLILAATRAVVTFGGHDARRYAWVLLGCAAAASIAGNMAHALLPAGPVHPAIAAVVAVVPPVAALAMTHLAVVRARVRQDVEQAASPQVEDVSPVDPPVPAPFEVSTDDASRPHLVAVAESTDSFTDARSLALKLIETQPTLSSREIARQSGVSASTVGRMRRDVAAA